MGRGFLWEQKHTHRLMQTYRPEFRRYVEPTPAYRLAARWRNGWSSRRSRCLGCPLTGWDVPFNPVRPLPPVGGLPRLHGIEPDEVDVSLPLGERVGHRWCWAPRASARRGWPSCSSPRTSGARTPQASTRS